VNWERQLLSYNASSMPLQFAKTKRKEKFTGGNVSTVCNQYQD